ncbi:hypothetical protein [Streptomyces clavifer]|uniref:hypothetical protein n=1 Tax=Streptomyces clavifer TaxID=68188 RepID=UPI0036564630
MNDERTSTTHDLARARQELTEWVDKYRQLRIGDSSWVHRSFADLVAEHGSFFPPARWPLNDPQQPGHCFKAAREYAERTGWAYVEGFALVPSLVPFSAFEHAWCLTDEGLVADPALPDGLAAGYYGVPLSDDFRREQQHLRKTDAVFTSDPSNPLAGYNDLVLRTGLPHHALAPSAPAR